MLNRIATVALLAACGAGVVSWNSASAQSTQPADASAPATQPATQTVEPKALSENVNRGLKWLVDHQLADGGWGQGSESARMGDNMHQIKDKSNVGDTCIAALALIRAGNTPVVGDHATNVRLAVEFICGNVEKADEQSLWVTDVRGTRLQSKLGNYVDTFLAALLLSEVKDRMPDGASNQRVASALERTLNKIEHNQQNDGGWANEGWAPALAQGLASKSINRAVQNGAQVDELVRKRAEKFAQGNFDQARGVVMTGGAAGVELYAVASNVQSIKDSDDTNRMRLGQLQAILESPTTQPEARSVAEREVAEIRQNERALAAATDAVVNRLDDKQFVAGFGSNGGEEFLSYMNIGETLVARGGDEWEKWDKSMTENLNRIQNDDGSWSGHHCITGQTFCTSAALMTLMTDRVTTPIATEIKRP